MGLRSKGIWDLSLSANGMERGGHWNPFGTDGLLSSLEIYFIYVLPIYSLMVIKPKPGQQR